MNDARASFLGSGLYTDIGPKGCHNPFTGSYGYYSQDAATFKEWEVDYVKCACNAVREARRHLQADRTSRANSRRLRPAGGAHLAGAHLQHEPSAARHWPGFLVQLALSDTSFCCTSCLFDRCFHRTGEKVSTN